MPTIIDKADVATLRPDYLEKLEIAYNFAQRSKDESTQIGACYEGTGAYNTYVGTYSQGILTGPLRRPNTSITGDETTDRYIQTIHAESMVLQEWQRQQPPDRFGKENGVLFCTLGCCRDCATQMLLYGVTRLVTHYDAIEEYLKRCSGDPWNIRLAHKYLEDNGVDVIMVAGKMGHTIRLKGEPWNA